MADEPIETRWSSADWLTEVHTWIGECLARPGAKVTGVITQPHIRPWATALRVPTDRGILWFKATTTALAHEAAVTRAISDWLPGRTPDVLAADPERNWLLMADGGVTLRSLIQADRESSRAYTLGALYASLQKDLAGHVPALLALNTPDCRLTTLPALYAGLLEDAAVLGIGDEEGLSVEQAARLRDLAPRVEALCGELAAFGIPETLQHDDLHSNNVLFRDGRMILFDWGDSSISHPFFSLVVLLRGVARDLDLPIDSPEVQDLRSVYLEAWDLPLSRSERDRTCLLADALGRISRALTWRRVLRGMEEPYVTQYASAVPGWLQEFLAAPALHGGDG